MLEYKVQKNTRLKDTQPASSLLILCFVYFYNAIFSFLADSDLQMLRHNFTDFNKFMTVVLVNFLRSSFNIVKDL